MKEFIERMFYFVGMVTAIIYIIYLLIFTEMNILLKIFLLNCMVIFSLIFLPNYFWNFKED